MSILLVPDELEIGMYATVYNGLMIEEEIYSQKGPKTKTTEINAYYKGKVLRIAALDLPYIAVEYYRGKDLLKVSLDMREMNLMALSSSFVKTIEPRFEEFLFEKPKSDWVFEQEKSKK